MAKQQPPQNGHLRFLIRAVALFVFSAAVATPGSTFATDILLGTDAAGSFSHFAGRAVCRVINRNADGLDCRVIAAPDGIHNLTNLQGGSLDIALVDTGTLYDAVNKKGNFRFLDILYDNLALLTPVYDRAIVLVVRADADIGSLDNLKGKRVNAGVRRSPTHQAMELIWRAKGWTPQDFNTVEALSSSLSQDTMAFCHGSVQAMLHIGVHPDSSLQKLINLCKALPVDMNDADITKLVQDRAAYSPLEIPTEAYPDLNRPVSTFGVTVALVASGSLDDQTVQEIMAVLDKQHQALQHAQPAMGAFTVGKTVPDVGVPLHPGAAAHLSQGQ